MKQTIKEFIEGFDLAIGGNMRPLARMMFMFVIFPWWLLGYLILKAIFK